MDTSAIPGSARSAEIEAKFLIREAAQLEDVLTSLGRLGYEVTEGTTATHTDRYFDTTDWKILRAGWAYRCREREGSRKLVLKSLGSRDGAVFSREEIEQKLPNKKAAKKGRLPRGPVQEHLSHFAKKKKRHELFSVRSRRTVYLVAAPGGGDTQLELDFDRSRIRARRPQESAPGEFRFMEIEFETDDAAAAAALAEVLRDRHGLIPSQLSKFERGMQAAGLTPKLATQRSARSAPKPKQPILDLVYFYLSQQLDAMKFHRPLAWEGLDPEGVHKMRVAIRRARTVLKEFRQALPGRSRDHLNSELRWLLKELGQVRDADVCEAAIEHYREGLHGDPVEILAPFEAHLRRTTLGAQVELVAALSSDRYRKLMAEFEQFIADHAAAADENGMARLSIAECEDKLVHLVVAKMQKKAAKIKKKSPARKLHRLRLLAKRLRYLLEFFRVARPKKWRAPIAALSTMQDELGEHQDAIVARQRLGHFAESIPLLEENRRLLLAMGRLTQQEEDRAVRYRRRFPKLWSDFEISIEPLL